MSSINELNLSWFCVSIESEEKARRKNALEELNKNLFDSEGTWTQAEYSEVWETVKKHLAKSLTDNAELCRNLTVELWKKFLNVLPANERHIGYLIPILTRRLSFQELQEPSEEVRLNYVSLLRLVVTKYKDYLPAYSDDLIAIFARTVTDNYPEIKRESSVCIEELACSIPVQFYSRSESLVKPILSNFNHQHYKVRVASIRAIGQVLKYGNSKSMDEVSTPMAQRLFDQSGAVRLAVVEVAGRWFLELRDRYSWWHKLIPLLVTGLHDEIENIRIRAGELWNEAGMLYLRENENDERLKDKIDFLSNNLRHYPHHSEKFKRPNLGCRVIVQQNLGKLLSGITRELADWLADVRVRSAQLLCVLVLNAEQDVTQHIEKLLPAMYRACNDEDSRVVKNVALAAEYMGYFVPPSIYRRLILPTFEVTITAGHLQVFASILGGSESFKLRSELPEIGSFLRQSHVCRSKKLNYQKQLIACCKSIMGVCNEDCSKIAEDLFVILFTVLATCQEESSVEQVKDLLESLAKIEKIKSPELYGRGLRSILIPLVDSCEAWTIYSDEFSIFRASLMRVPSTTTLNADLVLPILKITMNDQADPELRLKLFILLSEYFQRRDEDSRHCYDTQQLKDAILRDVVLPGLIWSAGRTAEAIRTAAVCCLCALLENGTWSLEKSYNNSLKSNENRKGSEEENVDLISNRKDISELIGKILPVLVTLVDDNAKKTRLYALRAICFVLKIGKELSLLNEEHVHATYPSVLKRLDDGCDDVRVAATEALVNVWQNIPKNYDLVFSRSHVDYLYTTMIIHLDDPDPKFQSLILDALLDLAKIHPQLLATKIENCRTNFRNQAGLHRLLNSCYSVL